jgi:lysophospholipase L1-like esterase
VPPLDPLLVPFWLSPTMHGESVLFVARDDGPAESRLLFPPDAVVAVTSAQGVVYTEGIDYTADHHAGRIVRIPGSRMPEVTPQAIAAADGALTHFRTVAVTYTHSADLEPWRPRRSAGAIPRVMQRLQRREPVTICLTGDSISEGYDASGFHRLPPFQPAFGSLVAKGLEQQHGSAVHLHNVATAGWTAANALWDTGSIAAGEPDLVIVAFGMNDASYAEAAEFAANIASVLGRVRDEAPAAEFMLVSPMLPTPECSWLVSSRFEPYREALAAMTGDGVVLADVTSLWTQMIARKDPRDLSGNGLNHPNDFGHRVYAHAILDQLGSEWPAPLS